MDLDFEEVSATLDVSEETLLDWVKDGTIPAYSIGNRYRFNREEIEKWLLEHPHGPKSQGQLSFNLFRALNKGDVFTDIANTSKEKIIEAVTAKVAELFHLDQDTLRDAILEREQLMPTAIGYGFGIPHARDFYLPDHQDAIFVVYLPKPLHYGALDGEPVHTLLFLFASTSKKHLSLLAKLAHLVNSPEMRVTLRKRPDKASLLELIKEWEATLKAH